MHGVHFTTYLYVVKNCINAHISFAMSWLNVTSWEMLKGWKWNLMVETFIQIWIPLSILVAISPKKQKNYFTFRPTWNNYSRIVMLCIHILACSYQWSQPIGAPMYSPSICSVPESKTLMRGPWLMRGEPFLYHLILGWGVPIAWQGRVATDFSGKVWLAGPICTMGGGTSSTDVTWTLMIMIMETRMTQSGLSLILGASF